MYSIHLDALRMLGWYLLLFHTKLDKREENPQGICQFFDFDPPLITAVGLPV